MPEAHAPRQPNRVFISLGSNIDPETHLPAAVRLLSRHGTVSAASRVYETLPVGFLDQANFLNAVVRLETACDLETLAGRVIPEIEAALHRVRDPKNRNGPRTIDLDIVLFNDLVDRDRGRALPAPEIATRSFVGIPLAEIAPNILHPESGQRLSEIARGQRIKAGDMRPRPDVVLLADSK